MAKNGGPFPIDTNYVGEWRYWDYLGWLPYPIWLAHVYSVYRDPTDAAWIDAHCPDAWQTKQRPQAEGETK